MDSSSWANVVEDEGGWYGAELLSEESVVMENLEMICWARDFMMFSAGLTRSLRRVRITFTRSRPYPSSSSLVAENSRRKWRRVFAALTMAL